MTAKACGATTVTITGNYITDQGLVIYYLWGGGGRGGGQLFGESLEDFQTNPPLHASFLECHPHNFYIL